MSPNWLGLARANYCHSPETAALVLFRSREITGLFLERESQTCEAVHLTKSNRTEI